MTCSSGYNYVNALRSPLQYFTTHMLTVTLVSTGCLRAKMLVQRPLHSAQRIIVPLTCFVIFVFPKLTKQEKMEDCVKGKQFWSSQFITGHGVCIACPSNWRNCYNEHIDDQKRCVDSCHSKSPFHCLVHLPLSAICDGKCVWFSVCVANWPD